MNIIKTNLEFNSNKTKRNIEDIKRIILHNSGVTVLQSIETIHYYHKNTRRYAGIGYHFYVRKDGTIYEGRPVEYIGAHAGGNNSDSIGVCFEGNFNEETMPEIQKEAGKWLVAYLKEQYNANIVQAHRDVNKTDCPGANFPFDEIVKGQVTNNQNTVTENTQDTDKINAIKRLQTALNNSYKSGLVVDGIVGMKTNTAIKKVALKNYCANEVAKWVQDRLVNHKGYFVGKTGIDGKYGKNTETAVREFQRDNGVTVDGIAGINTISLLI